MVELEVLFSARSPDDYTRRRQQLRDGFESLAMSDEVWQRALEVQGVLATKSAHRGAALPDLFDRGNGRATQRNSYALRPRVRPDCVGDRAADGMDCAQRHG